jgi:hypothetical protein
LILLHHQPVIFRGDQPMDTKPVAELGRALAALLRGPRYPPPPGTVWCYGWPGGRATVRTGDPEADGSVGPTSIGLRYVSGAALREAGPVPDSRPVPPGGHATLPGHRVGHGPYRRHFTHPPAAAECRTRRWRFRVPGRSGRHAFWVHLGDPQQHAMTSPPSLAERSEARGRIGGSAAQRVWLRYGTSDDARGE